MGKVRKSKKKGKICVSLKSERAAEKDLEQLPQINRVYKSKVCSGKLKNEHQAKVKNEEKLGEIQSQSHWGKNFMTLAMICVFGALFGGLIVHTMLENEGFEKEVMAIAKSSGLTGKKLF